MSALARIGTPAGRGIWSTAPCRAGSWERSRIIAMVRARVEHPFRVPRHRFGHLKTRYRGVAKNLAQLFTLFAHGNLFLV